MAVGFGAEKVKKPRVKKGEAVKAANQTLARRLKIYSAMILQGKSKTEAALLAGWKKSVARKAKEKIERPNQEYFASLADHFIPDELMLLRTRQGLDATTVKTASFNGVICDIQEFADYSTRAKYIELSAQFKGRIEKKPGDDKSAKVLIQFIRDPQTPAIQVAVKPEI